MREKNKIKVYTVDKSILQFFVRFHGVNWVEEIEKSNLQRQNEWFQKNLQMLRGGGILKTGRQTKC